ncbi:MAG TPA: sigma-70 family RNA polymerase sigma factor [Ktedonobacteraceae bacterium]|nr:sigma-70 family RNA polymerase sigma factor [Ktedonobacteraceae bacterium]
MYQRQRQALDGSLIGDLYHKHAQDVLRYIHRYIFSKEEADDLLMEVFLAAIESATLLNLHTGEQLAWLQRVARNKVIDYQRRIVKRPMVALEEMLDSPFDTDHFTPEKAIVDQEELELCRVRLSTLPELQQQVLLLRFGDNLRTKEIASKLHKSDGAVRSLLLRSLNFLRDLYNSREEGQTSGQSR